MSAPGYVISADLPDRGLLLPLTAGAYVYSPGEKGKRGELLMVWHSFLPDCSGRELNELNELSVSCAELLLVASKAKATGVYKLDRREHKQGGSFANGERNLAWEMAVGLLWSVDHLVRVEKPSGARVASSPGASPRFKAADIDANKLMSG